MEYPKRLLPLKVDLKKTDYVYEVVKQLEVSRFIETFILEHVTDIEFFGFIEGVFLKDSYFKLSAKDEKGKKFTFQYFLDEEAAILPFEKSLVGLPDTEKWDKRHSFLEEKRQKEEEEFLKSHVKYLLKEGYEKEKLLKAGWDENWF